MNQTQFKESIKNLITKHIRDNQKASSFYEAKKAGKVVQTRAAFKKYVAINSNFAEEISSEIMLRFKKYFDEGEWVVVIHFSFIGGKQPNDLAAIYTISRSNALLYGLIEHDLTAYTY